MCNILLGSKEKLVGKHEYPDKVVSDFEGRLEVTC